MGWKYKIGKITNKAITEARNLLVMALFKLTQAAHEGAQTSVAVHRFNGFSANSRPSNSRASLPMAEKTVSNGTAGCGLN